MAEEETVFEMINQRKSELDSRCLTLNDKLKRAKRELDQIELMLSAANKFRCDGEHANRNDDSSLNTLAAASA